MIILDFIVFCMNTSVKIEKIILFNEHFVFVKYLQDVFFFFVLEEIGILFDFYETKEKEKEK